MIRVRIALTPAGHLFLGSTRVALANFLHARRHRGTITLRFDDLDAERCRPEFADSMRRDLEWFGVGWDACEQQSLRLSHYQDAIERLKATGRLYPCFESEEELRAKADQRRKRGRAVIYDREMLRLTEAQRQAAEAGGKRPYWRFRLSDGEVRWKDMITGPGQAKLTAVSDPILVKADGTPMPVLAGVVDDLDLGITHMILGEDSEANTGVQIDLRAALAPKAPPPLFAHVPNLIEAGSGRSRHKPGAMTIRALRGDGFVAAALAAYLSGAGGEATELPSATVDRAAGFNLRALRPLTFDTGALLALNRRAIASLSHAVVADQLPPGTTEAFWLAIRGDIDLLNEARGWWDVVAGTIVPPVLPGEAPLLRRAADVLPTEPWTPGIGPAWIAAITSAAERAEDEVRSVLYQALTGEDHGPALDALLPLMGRARVLQRLDAAAIG
ncbi:MAG: glutamate--tRNA ligase [Acetobacteraceae bacterium]